MNCGAVIAAIRTGGRLTPSNPLGLIAGGIGQAEYVQLTARIGGISWIHRAQINEPIRNRGHYVFGCVTGSVAGRALGAVP